MKKLPYLGPVNGPIIGWVMKEVVRRCLHAIQKELFVFQAEAKRGYSGLMNDVCTTADRNAQAASLRVIREGFPTFGVLAEEDQLIVECTDPHHDIYFTIDPLDGTKAFVRQQSHGIGTMISLVLDGEIIAAYVGDVMTQEIYGFRPGSTKVHRISAFSRHSVLRIDPTRRLSTQNVVLRDRPELYSPIIRNLSALPERGGLFKDMEIGGGSIGIGMARLWKGEVGAMILSSSVETPWDANPVIGISEKLGFVFLEAKRGQLVQTNPVALREIVHEEKEQVVIHKSRLPEIMRWQRQHA